MPDFETKQFGKYLLIEKIAMGGMAELFRAKISGVEGFEKHIAIKKILPHLIQEEDLVKSFIDEAKIAAYLHHQNIIQIYDFGSLENTYFIAMEYLYGKDLRQVMCQAEERNLPVPLEYAYYIASRICDGLDYAHNLKDFSQNPLNIVHRDISPANIFITYDGHIKIVDFGIAKAATQNSVTQDGIIKGKVAYMSPEQAEGKTIDHRSDLFSCGILLYEMVTGTKMFRGEPMQILAKVRNAEFDLSEEMIEKLPRKIVDILRWSLAKDPDDRYQMGNEMHIDLEECIYQSKSRPTARGLSVYMKKLFQDEINAVHKEKTKNVDFDYDPLEITDQIEEFTSEIEIASEKPHQKKQKAFGPLKLALGTFVFILFIGFFFFVKEANRKSGLPMTKNGTPKIKTEVKPNKPSQKTAEDTEMKEAIAALESSKFDVAINMFEFILAKAPGRKKEIKPHYINALQGAAAASKSDPEKAKALFQKAYKLDKNNFETNFQLGMIYVKEKKYDAAIKMFDQAIRLDSKFPGTYFNLGYVYAVNKKYSKAEKMYNKVISLNPKFIDEAYFNLALIQYKQGKRKTSIKNLKNAIQANPKNKLAKQYLNRIEK